MKNFVYTAAVVAALGSFSASAVNIDIPVPEDLQYMLQAYVEYKTNGTAYPNFRVYFDNKNQDEDGNKLFSNGTITLNVTGPEGYTWSKTNNLNFNSPIDSAHTYMDQGTLYAGEYTYSGIVKLFYDAPDMDAVVEEFEGTITIPQVSPYIELTGTVVDKEGDDARINYNTNVVLYRGEPLTYTVELFEGKEATGTPVQTKDAAADGFVIEGLETGKEYSYTIKSTVEGVEMDENSATQTFTWLQATEGATFSLNLSIAPDGAFERTGSHSGKLPFKITATGDTDKVKYYEVRASRSGNEYMDQKKVTTTEGVFDLTDLNNNANTQVWLKVKAVSVDGLVANEVQSGPYDCDTRSEDAFQYTMSVETPGVALTETTGELKVTLNAQNAKDVTEYTIYAVRGARDNESGDQEIGRIVVKGEDIDSYPYSFTLPVEDLNPNTRTDIWVKSNVELSTGEIVDEITYPGQAQGWYGLYIDTDMESFSYDLFASNATAVTATTGTIDVTIKAVNPQKVDHFLVWVDRAGDKTGDPDIRVGETEIKPEGLTFPYTFKLDLSKLVSNAVTPLWVKCVAYMNDGTTADQLTYPGAAQGWTGFSIDTTGAPSGVSEVAVDTNTFVDVYNMQGIRVRHAVRMADALTGLPAGLYISGGRKVVVK